MAERTCWWIERWLECRAIYLSFYLSICVSICLSICLSIYLFPSVYLSVCLSLSIYLSIYLSIDLFVYLSICISVYLSVYLIVFLSLYVYLLDSHEIWNLEAENRSFSVRLPLNLEGDDIKNSARRLPPKIEVATTSRTKQFCEFCEVSAIFPSHVSKVLHLPRKSQARSYEGLRLSGKITLGNLKIWCSKMQPIRKSTPWPPNISDEHVSCTAPATGNASLIVPCLPWRWNCYKTFPHVFACFCLPLAKCRIHCACHAK